MLLFIPVLLSKIPFIISYHSIFAKKSGQKILFDIKTCNMYVISRGFEELNAFKNFKKDHKKIHRRQASFLAPKDGNLLP